MAYGKDGDFNFLEVGRAAFDLSDRGVSGRAQPGPVDAYLYTDRGIYRPGETRASDRAGARRQGRGHGVAAGHRALAAAGRGRGRDGASSPATGSARYEQSYSLARDARIGSWRVELRLDPKAPPIGIGRVPRRGFRAAAAQSGAVGRRRADRAGRGFPGRRRGAATTTARPGPELAVEARGDDRLRRGPVPERARLSVRPGSTRSSPATRQDVEAPPTDGDGKSTVSLTLSDLPDLTKPLAATVRVSVVRAERARRHRNGDAADPAASAGDRAALAGRR